nr:sterol regulatory element-binding protein 1 [Quercus suber]
MTRRKNHSFNAGMDSTMWQEQEPFSAKLDDGHGEDWEDWLRWDPAAEQEGTSPENGTVTTAGSSKNDSPLQENVFPAEGFGSKMLDVELLEPPMIMGVDSLDFAADPLALDQPFLFGATEDTAFDFNQNGVAPLMPAQSAAIVAEPTGSTWPTAPDALPDHLILSTTPAGRDENVFVHQGLSSATSTATFSLQYSPQSSTHTDDKTSSNKSQSSSPKPPPKKRGGRKRKIDVEAERQQREENEKGSQDGDEPPLKKTSHNVIEKRYRNNLNDKIVELRNSVPSLRVMGKTNGGGRDEDLEGLTPAHKLNKATVMGKATEYIRHLEKRNKSMADEMDVLKARLAAVEAAIGRSDDRRPSANSSPTTPFARSREGSSTSQGYLNVPHEQPRWGSTTMQPQYSQQQQHPTYARQPNPPVDAKSQPQFVNGRGGGAMTKIMLGAMAGVMVMEGFQQSDEETRGLAAMPSFIIRHGLDFFSPASPHSRQAIVPLIKVVLVIGCIFYLLMPLLTVSKGRPHPKSRSSVRLPHAPSLASPVEVRRKAWLTAMQTVYVPKHFLLEVVNVLSKMAILSTRRLIGSEAYNSLTGTNKEEEAARIKAWDIAIDAQLAGGDAEVSYYRLLLTLMASGTLPDSPTRLMQKAVHFRVFFWDVANAGYGNILGFKSFTEKVGKFYWDSARKLQKEILHAQAQGRPCGGDESELLPDHLASLLELDCDDVLGDEMIQRAWNLAWNKPSAYALTPHAAKDSVVEDHAIRSPLDAVAAWYANMTVDDTLVEVLGEHHSSLDTEYYIFLAISIAPPASATHVRALAAKAVLFNRKRESNIIAALEAFPMTAPVIAGNMNLVSHAPASPDLCMALTLAKLLALLTPNQCLAARKRAHHMLANLHVVPGDFSLLSAVAAYRLLRSSHTDRRMSDAATQGLEDMAANLRLWIGTSAGRNVGLDAEGCGRVVDLCLAVARKVGGWEEQDSGYGSAYPSHSASASESDEGGASKGSALRAPEVTSS